MNRAHFIIILGALLGLTDVISLPPKGGRSLVGNVLRLTKVGGSIAIMGPVFAASTCMLANLRGKDDYPNYWWGGVAAATAFCTVCKYSGDQPLI